jgi:hypothetical protein
MGDKYRTDWRKKGKKVNRNHDLRFKSPFTMLSWVERSSHTLNNTQSKAIRDSEATHQIFLHPLIPTLSTTVPICFTLYTSIPVQTKTQSRWSFIIHHMGSTKIRLGKKLDEKSNEVELHWKKENPKFGQKT